MSVLDLLPALPWLAPFASLIRLSRLHPNLSDSTPADGEMVSVIVPARNESANIETVVRSVLATSYRPMELLVVDDRSTDDTAAIVERLAAGDPRVRLVRGEPLPEGWYGKPWACLQGYREAKGSLLLFTDADTTHAPALLAHAVGALRAESVEHGDRRATPALRDVLGAGGDAADLAAPRRTLSPGHGESRAPRA